MRRSWAEVSRIIAAFVPVASRQSNTQQALCHVGERVQQPVSIVFFFRRAKSRLSAYRQRTVADSRRISAVQNARPTGTCDLLHRQCIYRRVTPSSFQQELPTGLIERARAGELAAFETIYRRFERPVFNLALRMLGDAESAREILHDAMLKVFQRIAQYRSDAPFWAWLRQIALNEALMRLRRDKHFDDRVELTDDCRRIRAAVGACRFGRSGARARPPVRAHAQRVVAVPRRRLCASRDRRTTRQKREFLQIAGRARDGAPAGVTGLCCGRASPWLAGTRRIPIKSGLGYFDASTHMRASR